MVLTDGVKLLMRQISKEGREKIRQSRLGKKWSDEIKEKMRQAKLGKKLSKEHIEKLTGRIPWNKGK